MTIVSMKEESKDDVRIRDLMVVWEKWRRDKPRLGYGKTILQKCLEGMPGTNCPTCQGRGKTNAYPTCPTCSGAGRVKLDPSATKGKVNPAFIPSTHRLPDDEISEKIDHALCDLRADDRTKKFYYVLMQEYTRIGTQQIKAERINISLAHYKRLLIDGHSRIQSFLDNEPKHAKNAHNRK